MEEPIFPYGRPVTGDHLVGREEVVSIILSRVQNRQSVVLAAPRRMGKTSVLLEVLRRLRRKGWFVGSVDIFDTPTLRDLSEKIVQTTLDNRGISGERIIRAAREGIDTLRRAVQLKHVTDEGYEIVLSFAGETKRPIDLLDEALDFPDQFAKRHGKRLCFAYDEFGDLMKMDGELIKKMRAKFQKHENTVYIFSGSQESVINELFGNRKEAFYGFADAIDLPPIPKDAFSNYIKRTFNSVKIECSSSIISQILELTEGHPYYTQLLCQLLYYRVRGVRDEIEAKDVREAFEEALLSQSSYLDDLWYNLSRSSPVQLAICRLLASDMEASPYVSLSDTKQNIYYALSSLVKKGILRKDGERYSFTDPFFREYILRKS